ncbi:aldehyde dehydrogenase [Pseudarthrobacter sulfonivorans]|uniref:aldehyde dehydrogenase family protein n=1 Tax=Pseudarthrobacter sulfonivorans TaxID=121292 RepID=UPI00168A7A88|nr:aldehyde dehydrogenase family protein [Pseudarthrobacter sulfonivorans]
MTATTTPVNEALDTAVIQASGPETYDVISPATERVVKTYPLPNVEDAHTAVAAARKAFDHSGWPRLSMAERAEVLERFCQAYEARAEEFGAAWTEESGPTVSHTRLLDSFVPGIWRYTLALGGAIELDEVRELPDGRVRVLREPTGVAVIITTWNGPSLYLVTKVIPALLAGCTVVMKPAVESQITSRVIAQMASDAGLPEGVLTVVPGGVEVSQALVSHPDVDKVSLTGSVGAGRAVMESCAANITDVTLELGGKSPALVVGDFPLGKLLEAIVPGFLPFQGQVCVALSRVLVPRERQEEVIAGLAEAFGQWTIGSPLSETSMLGPLGTAMQYQKVTNYIRVAHEQGARLVAGGGRPAGLDEGFYVEPTIFADVTPEMDIAREEIFGPVLAVMPYDDLDEAIEIANGTDYGLSAAVFASDPAVAENLALRIDSGTVAINSAGISFFAPFGGTRKSGLGRENGIEGIEEFLRYKAIKLG